MSQFAAIFDWNGTLLDDTHEVHRSFTAVQSHFGLSPCSLEDYRQHYEMPIDRIYLNIGFSQKQIDENRIFITELFHKNYGPLEARAGLRAGAVQTLHKLSERDWHCVVLSNHFKKSIEQHSERLNVAKYFKGVLAQGSVEEQLHMQPKADRLHAYMEKHKLRPEHAMIIGDTPEEIRIAHEHGMVGVALTGGYASEERLKAEKPDFLIHYLDEIPAIADKLSRKGRVR